MKIIRWMLISFYIFISLNGCARWRNREYHSDYQERGERNGHEPYSELIFPRKSGHFEEVVLA